MAYRDEVECEQCGHVFANILPANLRISKIKELRGQEENRCPECGKDNKRFVLPAGFLK